MKKVILTIIGFLVGYAIFLKVAEEADRRAVWQQVADSLD